MDVFFIAQVVERLKSNSTFGGLYTDDNVCISGTHTHSGPAGYFQYSLYQITSLGHSNETVDALVDGKKLRSFISFLSPFSSSSLP